ncbi:hypothetical protein M885DRAFT_524223 [Pelagophyceae sp. CCMP2097]|nr:hypothetical protein M885DRAFT_524223 [Pelagophyceae sp. CCMP2097]|mmetsp:Transcript_6639/g.21464  ORF Transcript_6639/g.21464 Transcript_6639/m.21464 type:complete len:219 (+) Transcript_6639:24-680(+)|eukprot:CAMPEP_0184219782 /NCGR_PEP_ID=MMETSP0976-20121227/17375_1 /TAXON_ID=483370 /ORGANISM="non described non described, Strain CCMP2097" /LENGTH=218 /DNA_ID=CAMNT_0026524633 /DNA_START=8 /DNA_END=664 /DNA_ORIENTATION=+
MGMRPPPARRLLLSLVAVAGVSGWQAVPLRRATLRATRTLLSSTSKPAPESPDVFGGEGDVAAASPLAPVAKEVNVDEYSDMRARIRERAGEMNLRADETRAGDMELKNEAEKNILEQIAGAAIDEESLWGQAEEFSDGRNVVEGVAKEFGELTWPSPKDVLIDVALVISVIAFMVAYVWACDASLHKLLDDWFFPWSPNRLVRPDWAPDPRAFSPFV